MIYVFGWRSFVIRRFTLQDIGLDPKTATEQDFEVQQAYFHIFWIPFFSLCKRWVVRNGDKMYLMPEDIKYQAKQTLTGISTPFYTYIGPILLAIAALIYTIGIEYRNYTHYKLRAKKFKEEATALTAKLQHLTTSDFITLSQQLGGDPYAYTYLKVENVKGDDIMVTVIKLKSDNPMFVESAYTEAPGHYPLIKVSLKQLLQAFPKEYDSSMGYAGDRQNAKLLNNGNHYRVKEVIRHFRPILTATYTNYYYDGNFSISCYNEGWPATITEIKNLEGNIDWSEMLNTTFPGGQRNSSSYKLKGKNITDGEPYKIQMTLKDTAGHFHKYELEGTGDSRVTIHAL